MATELMFTLENIKVVAKTRTINFLKFIFIPLLLVFLIELNHI